MKFSDIPGNSSTKEALKALADSDRIPHALMFCGISGIGKMLTARAFAQYIHCIDRQNGEPCGKCSSCLQHASFNHPDLHFVYPIIKSDTKKILISTDEIDRWKRMLTEYPAMPTEKWLEILDAGNSQPKIYVHDADHIVSTEPYSPFSSKYKIYIIWQPERLQPEAANKLLKVIEEPTQGTIFILVSNEDDKVLPTISSRTQRFHFVPLTRDEVTAYLEQRYHLRDYDAYNLSRLAAGRISIADELGGHSGETEEFEEMFKQIMRAAYGKRITLLKTLSEKTAAYGREKLMRFLDYMGRMTRENFIFNFKMPELSALTRTEEEFSKKFSPFINHGNVEGIIAEIGRARNDIARNANGRIVMFDFFLLLIGLLLRKQK